MFSNLFETLLAFVHGQNMYMWFGNYPQCIFFTFITCELFHFLVWQFDIYLYSRNPSYSLKLMTRYIHFL